MGTLLWGLLPDSEPILNQLGRRFHVSPRNPFALISEVGEDCAGAVQFVRPERLDAFLSTDHDEVEWLTEAVARTSVGCQRVAFARALGLPAARFEVRTLGDITTIVVTRYDRIRPPGSTRTHRVHQEDFCQALRVHPSLEYQNEGGPGPKPIVDLLRANASGQRPDRDVVTFLDALILNWLSGWSIAPIVIATQALVALGDEVGASLQANLCAVLIGERPELSVANSLGVYPTYRPQVGRMDSERNCISNIHADGLSYEAAADRLVWLMTEARSRKLTGVGLKDDRAAIGRLSPERLRAPHLLE